MVKRDQCLFSLRNSGNRLHNMHSIPFHSIKLILSMSYLKDSAVTRDSRKRRRKSDTGDGSRDRVSSRPRPGGFEGEHGRKGTPETVICFLVSEKNGYDQGSKLRCVLVLWSGVTWNSFQNTSLDPIRCNARFESFFLSRSVLTCVR